MKRWRALLVAIVVAVGLLAMMAVPASAGTRSRSSECGHNSYNWHWGVWRHSQLYHWHNVGLYPQSAHYHHRIHYVWNSTYGWLYDDEHHVYCGIYVHQ